MTLRIVPANEAAAAQNEARDAFLATVEATTRLGRTATIAITPERPPTPDVGRLRSISGLTSSMSSTHAGPK